MAIHRSPIAQALHHMTDADSTRTFYSEYASWQLGIPESPAVHFAICTVSELLKRFDSRSRHGAEQTHNQRVRIASRAVLEGHSYEFARRAYLCLLDTPMSPEEEEGPAMEWRTDWLSIARTSLELLGIDTGSNAHAMRGRYGWQHAKSKR